MIKISHKTRILKILCLFNLLTGSIHTASAEDFPGSLTPWINSSSRTLSEQTLSPATYPHEAELFCNLENCIMGLTHELVIGGDAVGMIAAPMRRGFDRDWVAGSTVYLIDVFGGFQVLRDVSKNNMNAQIGFRRIYLSNGGNEMYTQGITTAINYSTAVTAFYEQGLRFSGYFNLSNAFLNNTQALNVNANDHEQLNIDSSYFYRLTQPYPTFRVSFPADVELANWNPEQTNLSMPLRVYAHLEPFYIQNNLNFSDNNLSLQEKEQNFGNRVAGIVTYESTERSRSYRYALKGAIGLETSSSQFTIISTGNANLSLPNRLNVVPYLDLAASLQF